jgi:hypothetical protein
VGLLGDVTGCCKMPDIRAKAAAAAREWRSQQKDPHDSWHDIGEAAVAIGFELGYEAARAEVRKVNFDPCKDCTDKPVECDLCRFGRGVSDV